LFEGDCIIILFLDGFLEPIELLLLLLFRVCGEPILSPYIIGKESNTGFRYVEDGGPPIVLNYSNYL